MVGQKSELAAQLGSGFDSIVFMSIAESLGFVVSALLRLLNLTLLETANG